MWELYNGTATSTACTTAYYYQSCTNQTTSASNYVRMIRVYNTAATTISSYHPSYIGQAQWFAGQQRLQAAELARHPQEARDRALSLLLSHLTATQREMFEKNKWFIVEGGRSKRRYRIHANDNVAANIEILDGERTLQRLCGHCDISKVPLGDHLLAQKIMLESAEDDFLRIANRHAA